MNRLVILAAFALSSCTTLATPQHCQQAAAGLNTASQIAQVLIARGIEPAKAHKLADAVVAGQLLLAAACAQARP